MNHHCAEPERYERQGFPEAIYAPGKTLSHIIDISHKLLEGNGPVIITRADGKIARAVRKVFPKAIYHKTARLIIVRGIKNKPASARYLCVVTAGTGDIPVAEEAAVTAELLGNSVRRLYDVGVSGVHRLLSQKEILMHASCVVVCAGMEGALPSVVGGIARCPVIGVPTSIGYGASFGGISALLTMLNSCAANVSVVNIDDGFGAGIVASLINRGGND